MASLFASFSKLPLTTVALIVVCAGSFIGPLGMASVNIAIPDLAAELHANAKMVSWLPTIFLLANVALMLPFGKLADNYGRKRIYSYGLVLNILSSTMCALAYNIEWLLFWRFMQGAAAAMIFGTGVAILTSVTPAEKRGFALGIAAACVYIGLTVAPAVGGWLTELWGWRSVFLFQVPLVIMLLVLIKLQMHGEWKNERKVKFDWRGSGIFIVAATCLVFGLSQLPSMIGVVLLSIAVIAMVLFVVHQSKRDHPLIRVQMFKESRVFSMSLITSLLMYASNYPLTFLLSLYLQYVKGFSPSESGQIILLQALAMAFLAPLSGRLSDKVQPRLLATTGCCIVACGFFILSRMDIDTQAWYIGSSLLLIGIGFGLFSTPNNNAIMGAVHSSELGVASASLNLARTIGNLVGMSLVNLLVHHYIGDAQIVPEQYPALLQTVLVALNISFGCVVLACLISGFRGREKKPDNLASTVSKDDD
ncbi:MFS transporter [uncultured Paraglaciecola sp.]|uniref:MFS transporter n=1 Tax=uncultured Paraglaciecola sp. TaxID=1765024 RepID=UPI0030D771A7|tara:strand:+ start:16304 stop:17737 length:1434 start_codon:yes stop_codon:yes gene_type:complete